MIARLLGACLLAAVVITAPSGEAAAVDARVEGAVDSFLAGDYAAMFEALAAAARDDDVDALRLLSLIHKSGHPANDRFTSREAWRDYVASTGSEARLGTGWDERLAALGDPYPAYFLRGNETPGERVAAVRFFAVRGEWLRAFQIAESTLHLTGGPGADEAFSLIARSGLHDAAGAALRARLSAVFQSPEAGFTIDERVRVVADFAKAHWDHHEIGIVDGLADLIVGVGGPEALAGLSAFSAADLDTVVAVAASDPSRWRRIAPVASGAIVPGRAAAARERADAWWRAALASGRWLKHDIEVACSSLCPGNLRRCDTALAGGVLPRAWVCLNPHGALIADERYRGSVAETDCFRRVFADDGRMPHAGVGQAAPLAVRFAEAQRRGRCLP